eukprot:Gb_28769 [translate_table: standard]
MALAPLLWNSKKKMMLLFMNERTFTLITNTNTRIAIDSFTTALQREKLNVNDNITSLGICEDVRRVYKQGLMKDTLQTLYLMDSREIQPDSNTYASLLQGCIKGKVLPHGRLVHTHMILTGVKRDISLETKLVTMYAKCGSLMDARRALAEMPERNVVSWTAMITAYSKNGHGEEALALFYQMQRTGIQPNQFTFASALPACANMADLEHGKEVHGSIIRCGFQADIFVGNALVDMYAKCRSIVDARQVFDEMPHQDMVSGNAMIAGYAQNENVDEALNLFQKMPERNVVTWTAMIAGCARHGRVNEALNLFQKMPERNAVSWAAMIAGFAQNGYSDEARKLYREMQLKGVKPNSDTFASVLPAYANLADLRAGKEVHEDIIRSGCVSDVFVGSALVDMYAKCGSLEDAQQVFEKMPRRDVVSWTTMIAGYAQNGHVDEAVNFFQKMPERNLVSWNAMIAGFVQNGHFDEAFKLFRHMQLTAMKPNLDTFASVLPACANLAALHEGKEVHVCIITSGYQIDVFVGSALVDMYAKCGSIEDARKMFDNMLARDVVSWTAMIVGYAMHGYGKEAIKVFEQMQHSGTKPDHITFVGVLSACCHAGLVDDGWQYFECMRQNYHITPAVEHYCCMIDLLGRAGCLDEALDFVNKMPIKPDAAVWGSLLGACRNHTNIKLGQHVAECLFEADPKNAAHYVLLSNIYAAAGRWDDAEMVRKMMRDRRIKKLPGCSWIEVNYKVHTFFIGDRSHPETHNIYAMLKRLSGQMKEAGYAPNMDFVLHDVEEEQKDHVLCQHSEKLAIAFGLLQTCPGTTIRIVKNLRVCGDCHTATKFISKIVAREIVVRDVNRFHHFKDGYCSCGDYW